MAITSSEGTILGNALLVEFDRIEHSTRLLRISARSLRYKLCMLAEDQARTGPEGYHAGNSGNGTEACEVAVWKPLSITQHYVLCSSG